jgi:hypothetical protein
MTGYFDEGYNDILVKLGVGPGGAPTGPIVGKKMLTQTAPPKIQGRKPIPSGSLRPPGAAPAAPALGTPKGRPNFLKRGPILQ